MIHYNNHNEMESSNQAQSQKYSNHNTILDTTVTDASTLTSLSIQNDPYQGQSNINQNNLESTLCTNKGFW